ncbi:MAG: hypothetical protein Tsb0020_54300 [Haliangiales bacterium]
MAGDGARPVVYLCSPWAGEMARHLAYARRALADSLRRGEAPVAVHLLYPQVLDDGCAGQRGPALEAGLAVLARAERVALYRDLGVSPGMMAEAERALALGIPVETRLVGEAP